MNFRYQIRACSPLEAAEGGGVYISCFRFLALLGRLLEGKRINPSPFGSGGGGGRFLGEDGSGIHKAEFPNPTTLGAGKVSGGIGAGSSWLLNLLAGNVG